MKGKVYLVGAGPGDFKLISLKGMEVIKKAEVIVYDRLVNKKLLSEIKEDCELIYVGKQSSNHTMKQDDINKLLAEKAKEGKLVVRLKGGDPYVFGRGGEEVELLYEEGIDFEVVPGITSAIGGLCYAGIPITHRDYASSFHVITGHLKDEDSQLNFDALVSLNGTLVFLMGMSNLKDISEGLIKSGKDKKTPAAVINWATWTKQKVAVGSLENIYEKALEEGLESPSLIVVGDVVKLREKLNFYEKKPLLGKNIIVTRARTQSSSLSEKIEDLGGEAIEVPAIKINKIIPNEDLNAAINDIKSFNYIIFTSTNGVQIFFERLFELGFDSRAIGNSNIVAIGKATEGELMKYGIKADIVPQRFVSEAIVEELSPRLRTSDSILIPRAKEARDYLTEELSKLCNVTEIKTYETVKDKSEKEYLSKLINKKKIDYITFTSSSTVKNFIELLDENSLEHIKDIKLISIGPVTSGTIKEKGLKIYKEAQEYSIDGLIQCILNDLNTEDMIHEANEKTKKIES